MPPRPSTQRTILRQRARLPAPILRLMAGGGVVYQGGRTLDPRFQFLAAQARKGPPLTGMTPEEARRASAQAMGLLGGAPQPGVRAEPITIDGPRGPVPCRIYRPDAQ